MAQLYGPYWLIQMFVGLWTKFGCYKILFLERNDFAVNGWSVPKIILHCVSNFLFRKFESRNTFEEACIPAN